MSIYRINGNKLRRSANIQVCTVNDWIKRHHTFYADIFVSSIQRSIYDSGSVCVFYKSEKDEFISLPSRQKLKNEHVMSIDALINEGTVRIIWTDQWQSYETQPPPLEIAVITIAQEARLAHPWIDYHDFETVCKCFRLSLP